MRNIDLNLKGVKELLTDEFVQETPELCQKYLDLGEKEKIVESALFKVEIKQHSDTNTGAGIAYSNNLIIFCKEGEEWREVFSTGMIQYRGAHNHEIDNWDLSFRNPAILEETKDRLVFGIMTGEQNVKIYQIENGEKETLEVFNVKDYESTKTRVHLLNKVVDDEKAFKDYVSEKLTDSWYCQGVSKLDNENIIFRIYGHADRPYDAIDDQYKIWVLVKGKGICESKSYPTSIEHPNSKFYRYPIKITEENVKIVEKNHKKIMIYTEVYASTWKQREGKWGFWSEKIQLNIYL
jgi:hypothetical protein